MVEASRIIAFMHNTVLAADGVLSNFMAVLMRGGSILERQPRFVILGNLTNLIKARSFLEKRGHSVRVEARIDDLPNPHDPAWNTLVLVMGVSGLTTMDIESLKNLPARIILTGDRSESRRLLDVAAARGWEILFEPYAPDELLFRALRLHCGDEGCPTSTSFASGSGTANSSIVRAFFCLVGCEYGCIMDLSGRTSIALAEVGGGKSNVSLDSYLPSNRDLVKLCSSGKPQHVVLYSKSSEKESGDYLNVLAVPLWGTHTAAIVLLFRPPEWLPFTNREIRKASILAHLSGALSVSHEPEKLVARYREVASKVVEHLPSGVILVDRNGRIFAANNYGASIIRQRPYELVGKDIKRLFRIREGDTLWKALRSRDPSARMEHPVQLPSGETIVIGLSTAPYGLPDDKDAGVVLIFQDISNRKRLQEQVRRTDNLVVLGAMAAGMAHEIRNPLASILSGVQILGTLPPDDPRAVKHLDTIVQQITRLNGIIRDLLTLGRPAMPKKQPSPAAIPISRALETVATQAEERDIKLEVSIPEKLSPFLGDEAQIEQVLLNLFLNAIEAMPDGGDLKVRARERRGAGVIEIEVSDSGKGIQAEDLPNVFTPFFSTRAEGSGLGLSVCNRIIADHDGQLDLTTVPGKGTSVTIILPMADAASPKNT